ncbi:unnamed protein product, partial [Mesorhabditis spiculigera]
MRASFLLWIPVLLLGAEAFREIPIEEYERTCFNDGVYVNGTLCQCQPYFTGDNCANRLCINGGHNAQLNDFKTRCVCPPGFQGTHCEPQPCRGDVSSTQTFSPPNSKRSASFYFTLSKGMNAKLENDNILDAICNLFDSPYGISELNLLNTEVSTFRIANKAACQAATKYLHQWCAVDDDECPESVIPATALLNAIRGSLPHSPIFIITNVKSSIFADDNDRKTILQLATSLRITLNPLLFAPDGTNHPWIYDDPGYKDYSDLAEATGGLYLTPYDTSGDRTLGDKNITDAMFQAFTLSTSYNRIEQDPNNRLTFDLYSADTSFYFYFREPEAPSNFDTRADGARCLYPSIVAQIQGCTEGTVTWVKVSDQDDAAPSQGILPLYCGAAIYVSSNGAEKLQVEPEEEEAKIDSPIVDAGKCLPASPNYLNNDQFVLGLVIDNDPAITEQLLQNPGNIFETLVPMWPKDGAAVTSMVGDASFTTRAAKTLQEAIQNVMNNIATTTTTEPHFANALQGISNVAASPLKTYFDLFVIAKSTSAFTLNAKQQFDALAALYKRRIRVNWLWVRQEDPVPTTDQPFDTFSRRIAAATGGISHVFDDVPAFFANFKYLFGNELAYSQEWIHPLPGFIGRNLVIGQNETLYFVVEGPPSNETILGLPGNPAASPDYSTNDTSGQQISVFKYFSEKADQFSYRLQIDGGIGPTSFRIYGTHKIQASIAFSDTQSNGNDLYGPIFGEPVEYPVFATVMGFGGIEGVAIYQQDDLSLSQLDVGNPKPLNSNCTVLPFPYYLNYNWICAIPNQLYHVQMSINASSDPGALLRTFSFVCNSDSDAPGAQCGAHGKAYKDTCACNAGWTGTTCTTPVCQNGGNVTSGQTCICPNSTSGFFCEYLIGYDCIPESELNLPEYRSNIGSLIFVVEENDELKAIIEGWTALLADKTGTDLNTMFQSVQIIVVTYSDANGVKTRLVTNDPKWLAQSFGVSNDWGQSDGDYTEYALIEALDHQTTDRSLLLWISSTIWDGEGGPDTTLQKALYRKIADKRADVRIYSAVNNGNEDPLIQRLAMMSATVPVMLRNAADLNNTLPKNGQFGPILTTLDYSADCANISTDIYIPDDDGTITFITFQGFPRPVVTDKSGTAVELFPVTDLPTQIDYIKATGVLTFQFMGPGR